MAFSLVTDPSKWSASNVLSWLQWTTNQFGLPAPITDQWDVDGSTLASFSEDEFIKRAPQVNTSPYIARSLSKYNIVLRYRSRDDDFVNMLNVTENSSETYGCS